MHQLPIQEPSRSPRVSALIQQIGARITDGTWPIGTRLPVEAELMQTFEVGRVTLRQAIQALVHVGMLETIQGNGTFVRAQTELDTVLTRYLGTQDLRSILEVRLAIESEASALAADRATPADLALLDAILEEAETALAAGDRQHLDELSSRFHHAVVDGSKNPMLAHVYEIIDEAVMTTFQQGPETYQAFVREHTAIVQAIRTRDAETARRLAREHLAPLLDL